MYAGVFKRANKKSETEQRIREGMLGNVVHVQCLNGPMHGRIHWINAHTWKNIRKHLHCPHHHLILTVKTFSAIDLFLTFVYRL